MLFLQVAPKVQSIDCPNVQFWTQNVFSANDRFLVELSSEHYYAHFVPKNEPILVQFLVVAPRVQSIDCPHVQFLAQNVFSANDRFLVELSSEHHYAHFVPKNVPVLVLFLLVVPKVQSIDCPNVHFWTQIVFSANDRFWVELSSEHHYAHFVPKHVPILVLFLVVAPRAQSIDCPNVHF